MCLIFDFVGLCKDGRKDKMQKEVN